VCKRERERLFKKMVEFVSLLMCSYFYAHKKEKKGDRKDLRGKFNFRRWRLMNWEKMFILKSLGSTRILSVERRDSII
jgi:hypothetical protein